MELQSIIQSEVSHKEKYKCHILMHIRKMVKLSYLQSRNRGKEADNKYMDTKRKVGMGSSPHMWGYTYVYQHIYTIDTIYKIEN